MLRGQRHKRSSAVQNYFNYFTEIEQRFQQRRGSLLMLSTLDWALIEAWRESGIPLDAVLRGIDASFDKHDARAQRAGARQRKINGLAWCSQGVMEAVEQMKEASIGMHAPTETETVETGFEAERVAAFLEQNAATLRSASQTVSTTDAYAELAARLDELAATVRDGSMRSMEDLDRILTVLEEKLLMTLIATAPEDELVRLREQAARELAPYRGKMQAVQIKQVTQQFLQKRILEARKLPRLSLFYMAVA